MLVNLVEIILLKYLLNVKIKVMSFELKKLPKQKKETKIKTEKRVYINTLTPNFDLNGQIVTKHTRNSYCIKL